MERGGLCCGEWSEAALYVRGRLMPEVDAGISRLAPAPAWVVEHLARDATRNEAGICTRAMRTSANSEEQAPPPSLPFLAGYLK